MLLAVMLFMVMLLLRRWRRSTQLLMGTKKPDQPTQAADVWAESARRMQVDPDHSDDDDVYRQVDE